MVQLNLVLSSKCLKHPEVKYIGFLTLLFAGTISIAFVWQGCFAGVDLGDTAKAARPLRGWFAKKGKGRSFKYSILIDIVKKLKQWNKSAGNILFRAIEYETSETLRNETVKLISEHVPKHLKPVNVENFGHYLAGLIDGDGHFSSKQQLVIAFSSPDVKLAYYIKKVIGFGNVKKVKDKNAYVYIISNKDGIIRTINLINGKLRTLNKFNQVISNILAYPKYSAENINFNINISNDFYNHWIAGFSDADASFQIKFIIRDNKPKPEIRLNFQIDQKYKDILLLVFNL